ncbi:MAG: hypothetical protein O9302_01340 [Cyclobacteriaceae bacterium]|jgi:hypothetical protein|nr:hypothetical protein [Cytophagales bacterium]MCZ8326675.1 hypothetical protein [Cyclobacteriaceae bacterium]
MKLFRERPFSDAAKIIYGNIEKSIDHTPTMSIKNDNLEALAKVISKKHHISPPQLYFDRMTVETVMGQRSGREYPGDADVNRNSWYDCAFVNYTIPIDPHGNLELLTIAPTTGTWTWDADLFDYYNLRFTLRTFYSTTDLPEHLRKELKTKAIEIVDGIKRCLELLKGDCDKLNETLEEYTLTKLKKYKDLLDKADKQNDDLNPLK